MKVRLLAQTILFMLGSVLAIVSIASSVQANPYYDGGEVPAGPEVSPPSISLSTPQNSTYYAVNNPYLTFNVKAPTSSAAYDAAVYYVSYQGDWMEKPIVVFDRWQKQGPDIDQFDFSRELYQIPEGNHSLSIQAVGIGWYVSHGTVPNVPSDIPVSSRFLINSSVLVNFAIDTHAPVVSVLSIENKTYSASELPLKFTVNEHASNISYVLDSQQNVVVSGNVTLYGLSNAPHSLAIYVVDLAGNTGVSETVHFSVDAPSATPSSTPPLSSLTPSPSVSPSADASNQQPLSSQNPQSIAFPTDLVLAISAGETAVALTATAVFWKKRKINSKS